jgi:hypothetical protein
MPRPGYSPLQLFLSYGAIGAGAWLVAAQPGCDALLILDWSRLFLLAACAAAGLLLAERLASRRFRREEPGSYPYAFAVAVVLFGLGVALVGAVNGHFARTPPRVLRPVVRGWDAAKPAYAGVGPPRESRFEDALVTVDSWRRPGETLRIPVSAAAQEAASGPGPHALEVVVADGLLGIEYVEAVRLVER